MGRWEVGEGIPHKRAILRAIQALKEEKLILYPTDTTYAIGCRLTSKRAFDQLCQLRRVRPEKSLFSIFLPDVGSIGYYAVGVDTPTYRLIRRLWPGPYTIILRPGPAIPRHLWHRRTVGYRVSTHPILQALLQELEEPIITASVPEGEFDSYSRQVSEVLDAGQLPEAYTTVIDLSEGLQNLRILRVGIGPIGELEAFMGTSNSFEEA
ncbi:MAG: L-threonylcarbamoyladenylate synthase [Bacteroidia bacterium]|nr:L-threonylcarbamoyladenylate synthase [Bacteroidia bacterium]MDW8135046.1 L-threonylcarbamoyladenylate synthase [Bacteroidia bacterium]